MGRKREITGKAVIYTPYEGVKVADAEVRRVFNVHCDECKAKIINCHYGVYLPIGCARTVVTDNHYAMPAYNPNRIQQAVNYGSTKFFRFILHLMELAQFHAVSPYNKPINAHYFIRNRIESDKVGKGIDWDKRGADLDNQLYKKYNFTAPMINFLEAHYNDELPFSENKSKKVWRSLYTGGICF